MTTADDPVEIFCDEVPRKYVPAADKIREIHSLLNAMPLPLPTDGDLEADVVDRVSEF